ncbi:pyrroline-5-carboxylate reductase [Massilia sp. Dwa41.01b]|uniref:pyrroline-5-carboxylate reductase n=1 Tax=unclassified Massilia TaxID=2609279 RepID=UPI0015FF4073|nr:MULTISPECIES: pyrroline-5-carboxylate reductase [unclassified Massilia]QNA87964.1 pyrroline-5-carboxylate reductase [Massilia sp. Dwa41.01b]QNA98866.1 pyrroline-5-carboxylate reductase [Massilia sp. Se16.2.3]
MNIAFIGGGNMATALIAGLVKQLGGAARIHVVDPNQEALARLAASYGVTTAAVIDGAVAGCEVIVLAVKPQQMREVAATLAPRLGGAPLLLSIAAGIRSADLARWLGYGTIVRAMPNTPALIGMGITGMVATAAVSPAQRAAADQVMAAVGQTVWLDDEALIDPVTAVSGSGPAYVFYFLEAMEAAAAEMGLSSAQGKALALATFMGAAQLAAQSDEPLDVLRQRVTSKGGTTHAAIISMEASGVKEAIMAAMKAAAARGRELGDELGRDG